MRPTPRLRGLPLFGFAVAGLLLGHAISYLLMFPDPYHRDLILQRTGHGYLPVAGQMALVMLLAGMAAAVARAWTSGRRNEPEGFGALAGLLVVVQITAFVGQEVLERVVAGSPLGGLVHEHILVVGVVVQVALALLGATTLRELARASTRIAGAAAARMARPRPMLATALPAGPDPLQDRVVASARNVRAPPSA